MTENRIPSGVPTGGQFAASQRTEAEVSLAADEPTEDRLAAVNEALKAGHALRDVLDGFADDLDDAVLVVEVTGEFPDAAKISVSDYDDGNGSDAYLHIHDADGNVLDERIAPFRPSRLEGADDYDINVAEINALDLKARTEALRANVARLVSPQSAHRKSVWPENAEEKAAFADWQHEVANGDTCIDFRTWYENPDRLDPGLDSKDDDR